MRGLRLADTGFLGRVTPASGNAQAIEDFESYSVTADIVDSTMTGGSGWLQAPRIIAKVLAVEDFQAYSNGTPVLTGGSFWASDGKII